MFRLRKHSVFLITLSMIWLLSPNQAQSREKLIIFHAGSLAVPMQKMEKIFEKQFPNINVQREVGGSIKMARLISEVGKPADIMASADYKVIDNNLIPEYALWNIRFATNQLVLAYTYLSRYSKDINSKNWYKILQRKDVAWGHSDPNLDPCGYRTLMVMQLAEIFYSEKGLYKQLLANRPKKNIRPKSVELVNLIKSGNMDYAWEYLSVAVQHNLEYITLNDHINLGNYKYDNLYKQAKVKVSGKKPGTRITKSGKSCTYGVTILKDSIHPKEAILFLKFMLSPTGGLDILNGLGQPPFSPARIPSKDMLKELPNELKPFVEIKK